MSHSDLIDTTEMYLRTVYELEEEGVVPLRARIAERLGQSGPTVSQTVARMERDGLVHVAAVIGLDWEDVHIEACRWEHVMSEAVERRIVAMLDKPLVCPHGNPIPGLDELGLPFGATDDHTDLVTMTYAALQDTGGGQAVTIERISEQLQPDAALMHRLSDAGLRPGHAVSVASAGSGVEVWAADVRTPLSRDVSDHVFVRLS